MIDELENKKYLYSKSKLLNSIFIKREKTDNEIKKEKILLNLLLDFYQKAYDKNTKELHYTMFDYDLCSFGYIDNYGYYMINYDNWNYYLVHIYGNNLFEAFSSLARSILNNKRREYLNKNKKTIKNEYFNRFKNIKNYEIIFNAEYDLNKWNKYYQNEIPRELIDKYNEYVNDNYHLSKINNVLEYNKKIKSFIITNKIKVRSLKNK